MKTITMIAKAPFTIVTLTPIGLARQYYLKDDWLKWEVRRFRNRFEIWGIALEPDKTGSHPVQQLNVMSDETLIEIDGEIQSLMERLDDLIEEQRK